MIFFTSNDILPNLKEEVYEVSEEEAKGVLEKSFNGEVIDEVSFIPKVNILFVIYDNYTKSRIIYVSKESLDIEDLGTLTIDNLELFSLNGFKLKEVRHEDFDTISEGVEVLSKIVIDNKGD